MGAAQVPWYDAAGTLRFWANDNSIPSITIEIGNPNSFQHGLIDETLDGIINALKYFQMIEGKVIDYIKDTTICEHSYWVYSQKGGIVDVLPKLADIINPGDIIAKIYNVFGAEREIIKSSHHGIVIGKNTNPNCEAGSRILHLGIDIIK